MSNSIKLITLNIWGGHVADPLKDFIKANAHVDIICLQEVYSKASAKITNEDRYLNLDSFTDIQELLSEHTGYFRPVVNGIYGIGMFTKKNLEVIEEGEEYIYVNDNYPGMGPTHSRILQYAKIRHFNNKGLYQIRGYK